MIHGGRGNCGKGPVLAVASGFPFRRSVGLEFAPPLAEIAKRNVQDYRNYQRCSNIEVITADGLDYELALEPQVLLLYNPFSSSMLDQIMRRIEDSFQNLHVIWLSCFPDRWDARELLLPGRQYEQMTRRRYMDIYRHRQPASASVVFSTSAAN